MTPGRTDHHWAAGPPAGPLQAAFMLDAHLREPSIREQAEAALAAGATALGIEGAQIYSHWRQVAAVRTLCRTQAAGFLVAGDPLTAKAMAADGVCLPTGGQGLKTAREILGPETRVGLELPDPGAPLPTGFQPDFLLLTGCGRQKRSTAVAILTARTRLPVVAGGIRTASRAAACRRQGAAGVMASTDLWRRPEDPPRVLELVAACGVKPRGDLAAPWSDEFDLIAHVLTAAGKGCAGQLPLGVGDDACLLPTVERPVLTTDTQREGVHFHSQWLRPEQIGQRAVEIAFSDLAASYAQPAALLVNLALPPAMAQRTAEEIYRGIGRALKRHDCPLAGGNTSRAERLALDLFALGRGHADIFPRRDAARPGDGLYVSGPLGLARAGLLCLQACCSRFPAMVERFKSPRARFDAADCLAAAGVRCVMDVSDGLAGDAAHLARASAVSIRLEVAPNDLDPEMERCCRALGVDALETAITGGEDYELLFACRPETFDKLRPHLPEARPVGRVLPRGKRALTNLPESCRSFQHGAGK